ncbi:hypothetical protein ACHHYP_20717 [Achlya hypogyna]|uniref:Uncharacterized protein n=1 Tax=Achlya hypogyna TaxID=1202772 RepID=A0A1V9YDP9_ACHHY|nr:hypothetical protein ACHHYP_20717 [Achlya hypogyna]
MDVVHFCATVWRDVQEQGIEGFLFPRPAPTYTAVPLYSPDDDEVTDEEFKLPDDYDNVPLQHNLKCKLYSEPTPRAFASTQVTTSLLSAFRA